MRFVRYQEDPPVLRFANLAFFAICGILYMYFVRSRKGGACLEIYTKSYHIPVGNISASEKEIVGTTVPHAHEFFELELYLGGEGENIVNGVRFPLVPGTLFLLTPGHIHTVSAETAHLINVMFQGVAADALTALSLQNTPVFHLTADQFVFMQAILREIVAVHTSDAACAARLLQCALEKLARCENTAKSHNPPLVQRAITYMLENFRYELSAEQVARHVGLSRAYFSDRFRRETGIPFKEYLDSLRFSHVCSMLTFTDQSVRAAAESAGFRDYANFSRRFRDRFGCTPREWRKEKQ